MSWIQTFTGKKFDVLNPRAVDVCWRDVAHSLANQCRFNGHTQRFYSVAHHCVLASVCVPERFALVALLHDAAEAYIGDMPKPVKNLFPDFSAMEKFIMAAVHEAAGIAVGYTAEESAWVNGVDDRLLITERDQLMGVPPAPWALDHPDLRPLPLPIVIEDEPCSKVYEDRFLRRLEELGVAVDWRSINE